VFVTTPFYQELCPQSIGGCMLLFHAELSQDNSVQVEAWAPFAEGRNNIFQNELLLSIAAKHNKSVAQVILRWVVQRGISNRSVGYGIFCQVLNNLK
jgi:hypothetical protein